MYKKSPQGWLKHWDFIILDIFCLQLAFVVAYLVRQGLENPYSDQIYRTVAFVFMLCQIVVMFLGQSYQDILKRGYYIEFTKTVKHVLMVMLLSVLYLFATQQAVSYSRLTLFYTAFLYLCFDYVGRVWHKENVLKKNATKKKEKSMVVVVSLAEAKETIEKILSAPIQNFSINGIALIDDNPGVKEIAGIPVVGNMDTISEYLCHEWVARFARVFGADKKHDTKAMSQFMDKAVLGEDIILKSKGQQRYSYCYIADAVSGLLKLLLDGQDGEAYNISNDDDGLTLGEYAEYIASLANLKVRYEIENNESVSKATFALLDTHKIKNIGWKPQYSVKDGLKRTYMIKKEQLTNVD